MQFWWNLRKTALLSCAAWQVLAGASASAQVYGGDNSVQRSSSPPWVEAVVVCGACDISSLQAKTLSWFSPSITTVTVRHEWRLDPGAVLVPSPAGVRVWIVTTPVMTSLYFVVQPEGGEPQRYLVRELQLDRGLDELGLEQLAQVIHLSCNALWEGQGQSARAEFAARLQEPPPAAPTIGPWYSATPRANSTAVAAEFAKYDTEQVGWRLHSEIGYGARLRGAEGIAHGPQGALLATIGSAARSMGGRMAVQLLLPLSREAGPVVLDLRGYSMRATLQLAARVARDLSVATEIGPGLDIVRYSAVSSTAGDLLVTSSRWEARPMAWLAAGVELGSAPLRLDFRATLAVQLLRTHYDLRDGAANHQKVLTPWLVQPGFATQLSF